MVHRAKTLNLVSINNSDLKVFHSTDTPITSTYSPPLAWYTADSFPVLIHPLISFNLPLSTILNNISLVFESRACSWVE